MRSTKYVVSFLFIAELSCVWTFNGDYVDNIQPDVKVRSMKGEWICTSDADCTTLNSSCVNESCQCPPQYVFNAAMTSCLKAATNYGDLCEETSQCTAYLKAGGICNENRCTCSKGYHYIHGQCHKSAGLNQKCRTDDDCFVNSDYGAFSCKNETCVCRDGYYQREYRTCRLEATKSGAECTIDSDCTYAKNARCDRKSAKCFVESKNKTTNAVVRGSKYEASKSFQTEFFDSNMLFRKGCTSDEQCALLGEALCDSTTSMCVCKPGHFFNPKMPRCNAEIGEKCEKGDTNIIMKSTCRFGRWSCMGATVPSKNNRVCLKATTWFTEYCTYDEQCYVFGPNATCDDGACRCTKDSHYSIEHEFCWVNKQVGESCIVDEDCYVPGFRSKLACNSQYVCSCPRDNHVNAAGTACVRDVPRIGDPCSGQLDCNGLNNSMCLQGSCACAPHYFNEMGLCVNGIDAPCESDVECIPEHSSCVGKKCRCEKPYLPAATDLCIEGIPFGDDCYEDDSCSVITNNSHCNIDHKCDCTLNHHYREGHCYRIKHFDEVCNPAVDECYSNLADSMSCSRGRCRCNEGFSPTYNWFECEKLPSSGTMKYAFFSWICLILLSTRFMGLL